MKLFLIRCLGAGPDRFTVHQTASTCDHAIRTVQSTGAKVISAKEIDSTTFNELWPFIGGRLNICDNEAQGMALRLMAKGIASWEQWLAAGEVVA